MRSRAAFFSQQRDAAGDCRSAEAQNFPPGYFLGHFHSFEINALLRFVHFHLPAGTGLV